MKRNYLSRALARITPVTRSSSASLAGKALSQHLLIYGAQRHRSESLGELVLKFFISRDTDVKVGSAPNLTSSARKMILLGTCLPESKYLLSPGEAQAAREVG